LTANGFPQLFGVKIIEQDRQICFRIACKAFSDPADARFPMNSCTSLHIASAILFIKKSGFVNRRNFKKAEKIHRAAMTVHIDALWIFFYRLFMFDAFVLVLALNKRKEQNQSQS